MWAQSKPPNKSRALRVVDRVILRCQRKRVACNRGSLPTTQSNLTRCLIGRSRCRCRRIQTPTFLMLLSKMFLEGSLNNINFLPMPVFYRFHEFLARIHINSRIFFLHEVGVAETLSPLMRQTQTSPVSPQRWR